MRELKVLTRRTRKRATTVKKKTELKRSTNTTMETIEAQMLTLNSKETSKC